MNLLSIFRNRSTQTRGDRLASSQERLAQYERFLRAYQGYSIRGPATSTTATQWRRLKFNFTQTVVNVGAGWFSAQPLDWNIINDADATKQAYDIWQRSGSDCTLLEAALCAGIYGDIALVVAQDDQNRPVLEFVDPSICTPSFSGSDYSSLETLEIAYQTPNADGRTVTHREFYDANSRTVYEDDRRVEEQTYDQMPAFWIRNQSIKGLPYGISDIDPIVELVEEYDHLASKQTRIVDYYAAPSLAFKGVQKGDIGKTDRTVFFLPTDGDAFFVEWKGSTPDVEAQLTRIRNAIAEVSQVPAVAFGQADSGLTSISGVAMQILYGPLISKTHRKQASWGPVLEDAMALALSQGGRQVPHENVRVLFPSATPVDNSATMAEASGKIAARLSSRRTVMNDLGIEDPDAELKRIVLEDKLLQLAVPQPAVQTDVVTAAKAGAAGLFAQQAIAGTGVGKAIGQPAPVPSAADMATDVANLLERFDALLETESANIETAEEQPA